MFWSRHLKGPLLGVLLWPVAMILLKYIDEKDIELWANVNRMYMKIFLLLILSAVNWITAIFLSRYFTSFYFLFLGFLISFALINFAMSLLSRGREWMTWKNLGFFCKKSWNLPNIIALDQKWTKLYYISTMLSTILTKC